MNILVTGALGAVGTPLVEKLRRDGHDVSLMDLPHHNDPQYHRGDLGQYHQLQRIVREVQPEFVFNLAGEFGRWNGEHFYENMWQTNAIGTKNMIRLQEENGFRLVHFSSSEVYGDHDGIMTEGVMDTVPLKQMNDYAISKWVNEMQVLNSEARHGTETVRVRLFNTYGPGEPYSKYRSVVCLFAYQALRGEKITVYDEHTRTLTYIDDCVDALSKIPSNFKKGKAYNIAGEGTVDMGTLARKILALAGRDETLADFRGVEKHNTLHKHGSNELVKRDLGWEPQVSLDEGLARTIEWYREYYEI